MLNTVPTALNAMARQVVIHHPNAFNCQVFRKTVARPGPIVGGLPTLGGMMVLDSEDEEDIAWTWIGNGFAVNAEPFQASPMMDRQDAHNGYADEFRYLIEPEAEPGQPAYFDLKKHDVVYLLLGDTVKLAFEVVGIETPLNIPPYANRYVLNRRDDLHVTVPP